MIESNLEKFRSKVSNQGVWESLIYRNLKIKELHLEKNNSRLRSELPIIKEWINDDGFLINAALVTVIDAMAGFFSMALNDKNSVMTDLSVSYIEIAKIGDVLNIECYCPKTGKNLGFLTIKISYRDNILAIGKAIIFYQPNTNWIEKL